MNTQIDIDQKYRFTTDLGQAGTAATLGYPVDHLAREKNDHKKVVFAFKRLAGLDQVMEGYWNGAIKVKPQDFYNSLKMLKNRIKQDFYNG